LKKDPTVEGVLGEVSLKPSFNLNAKESDRSNPSAKILIPLIKANVDG
jgi:hypothetical protein